MAALAVAVHVSLMLAGFVVRAGRRRGRRAAAGRQAAVRGHRGLLRPGVLRLARRRAAAGRPRATTRRWSCSGSGSASARRSRTWSAVPLRQPAPYAMLASAQLGVPVAAATIGAQLDLLRPGEGAAIVLGALVALGGHRGGRLPGRAYAGTAARPADAPSRPPSRRDPPPPRRRPHGCRRGWLGFRSGVTPRALSALPSRDLRRGHRAGPRDRAAACGSRGQPGEPRLSLLRSSRLRQDHVGAHPGPLAQLRAGAGRRPVRRVRLVPRPRARRARARST